MTELFNVWILCLTKIRNNAETWRLWYYLSVQLQSTPKLALEKGSPTDRRRLSKVEISLITAVNNGEFPHVNSVLDTGAYGLLLALARDFVRLRWSMRTMA